MQQADELLATTRAFIIRSAALLLAVCVLLGLMVYAAGTRLVRPVADLTEATRKVAEGDYESRVPVTTEDELGRLGAAFNQMSADLRRSIGELQEATAAREKIESEIKIAGEIQMSLLPMIFPAFPNRPEFDLHAVMEPAREVGGDFYDFYFLNDYYLSFVIGDVSDKGIPAALFMAVTKTLLKASSGPDLPPDHIVRTVNRELARENKTMNFVTLFYGIYDLRTGIVRFCNAGHNPPWVLRAGGPLETLTTHLGGAPLGIDVDTEYCTETLQLTPGDQLVIYTDGVTEAQDTAQNFYGTGRFRTLLKRWECRSAHPQPRGYRIASILLRPRPTIRRHRPHQPANPFTPTLRPGTIVMTENRGALFTALGSNLPEVNAPVRRGRNLVVDVQVPQLGLPRLLVRGEERP